MPDSAQPAVTAANTPDQTAPPLDPGFAALLCCPVCADRPPLALQTQAGVQSLFCGQCGRTFPIVDGLPDLRPESGIVLPTPNGS